MRYGVYIGFDEKTETMLNDLRVRLFNDIRSMPPVKKMGPHLTLLIFDDADQDGAIESFNVFASACEAFGVALNRVGVFRGGPNVLFIEPALSNELRDCFLRCLNVFSDSNIIPAYQGIERWRPHVTLAKGMAEQTFLEAKALAEREWKRTEGWCRTIGLIDVQKPLDVLASRTFSRPPETEA